VSGAVPKRIALLQPLPSVAYWRNVDAYSEFGSLGLATLVGALAPAEATVHYPSSAAEAVGAAHAADAVVVGDFRPYTYFCNPKALIERVVRELDRAGFDGPVVVAGRHAAGLAAVKETEGRVCANMSELAARLGRPELAEVLGDDVLPAPGEAPADLVFAPNLRGSASRPTTGPIGQILIQAGCRYGCSFCERAETPRRRLTPDAIGHQLRRLRAAGATYLVVWDETFGEPAQGYDIALDQLREAGIPFGCNTRLELLTDTFVDRLARSGCVAVLVGVELAPGESRSGRALGIGRAKMPLRATLEAIIERLTRRGIRAVGSLLIGLPDDDEERIESRIDACSSLGFSHLYVRPLVPLPETRLYRQHLAKRTLEPFERWMAERWDVFPHGYPTLCAAVDREQLWNYSTRRR
jgi:hypothetical protein